MSRLPLHPWSHLAPLPCAPLSGGLINATWMLGAPPVAVLQRVNPIFAPSVHEDIEAVTIHLASHGLLTPRLVHTDAGDLYHEEEGVWRVLSWVPGRTHHKLRDPALAREAGRLVARWHAATTDLDHDFRFSRPLAHDTPHHMRVLEAALDAHPEHRLRALVLPVATAILQRWTTWQGRLDGPPRITHGDLKISNLRFSDGGEGLCLLDLDTMGWLPLEVELGDAWRSWCNPLAEDSLDAGFELELFAASAEGYLERNPLDAEQREALPGGIERICLELAARFAADTLNESYFGWDPALAPTRGEHNLLRARGQLALARSVRSQRGRIEAALGVS